MTDLERELRAKIAELEGRLRFQVSAASTSARTTEITLARLQAWQPVVEAARAFSEDPGSVNTFFALLEAVEALPSEVKPS